MRGPIAARCRVPVRSTVNRAVSSLALIAAQHVAGLASSGDGPPSFQENSRQPCGAGGYKSGGEPKSGGRPPVVAMSSGPLAESHSRVGSVAAEVELNPACG
jgi:hypothetical protein